MPLPKRLLKMPTLLRIKSTLHSVANSTTPNNLNHQERYVMNMGEKIKKNFKLRKLEIPTKTMPVIPKAMMDILHILILYLVIKFAHLITFSNF